MLQPKYNEVSILFSWFFPSSGAMSATCVPKGREEASLFSKDENDFSEEKAENAKIGKEPVHRKLYFRQIGLSDARDADEKPASQKLASHSEMDSLRWTCGFSLPLVSSCLCQKGECGIFKAFCPTEDIPKIIIRPF